MQINIDWNRFDSKLYRPLLDMEIPDFNPGTIAYDDFWDEQDRRCLDGYKPRPYMPKISNEHYFYLNMNSIRLLEPGTTRKTMGAPFYRELDRRLFDEIYQAKRGMYGLIIGKPRQVGLSWVGALTIHYELKFHKGNATGVAAGLDEKSQDFKDKVLYLLDNVRPEYRASVSLRNDEEIRLSYKYRDNKQDMEGGLQSSLFMKTMFAKPTGFEGKDNLSVVIFEEAGLFEDIIAAYKSTEPTFKTGAIQFGTPLVYGTGGEIDKGSKGYKSMWEAPRDVYNLKKIFVSATDYFPGDGVPDENSKKTISFFDFKTGRTNHEGALRHILAEREKKQNSEGFVKHLQTYPLKESEIFIKTSGGYLNRKRLNAQKNNLMNCPYLIKTGRLEWHTEDQTTLKLVARARNLKEIDKIHFQRNSKIVFEEDEELGTIKKLLDPIDHSKLPYNPDIGGIDSYDDEVREGSGSLGATIIYRCFHGVTQDYDLPISYILDRGSSDNDDEFYSNTFRLAVYYDVELLLEYTKIAIKGYFDDVGGLMHLKGRPDLERSGYSSRAINEIGFKMSNQHAWNFTLRLLKAEVNLNFNKIWFEELIDHLIDYGEENSDLGSAYGMVMVSKLDMFGYITDGIEDADTDMDLIGDMGHWVIIDGQHVFQPYSLTNEMNEFGNISIFDPEFDLEGEEREAYQNSKIASSELINKKREEVLEKYGSDIMAFTIDSYNKRLTK